MDARAVISGKEYYRISAPQISHSLATDPFSIGNCNAASLKLDVLLGDGEEIPEAASVRIIARLTDLDVTRHTETLPFGEFWVDTCKNVGNLYTLSCYDAMLKTSQAMVDESDSESDWPKSMAVVVQEIAYRIGVPIDPRTRINRGMNYMVPFPKGYTMQQVLGWIGACNGGNWTITEEGELRLVTLTAPPAENYHIVDEKFNDIITGDGSTLAWKLAAGSSGIQTPEVGSDVSSLISKVYPIVDDKFNRIVTSDGFMLVYDKTGVVEAEQGLIHVPFVGGDVETGKRLVVSKITMTDEDGKSYSIGDDTGFEITVNNCPYSCQGICNDLYQMLHGIEYEPFTAPDAVFDPATELGDQVKIGDKVHSSIYSMEATLGIGYSNTISAPVNTEATRQYPYLTKRDKNRDKVFLEASADYCGVTMSAEIGLLVAKTGSSASSIATQSMDNDRRTAVSCAEVQYSDDYIAMRARDTETGHMEDAIFYDDTVGKYRIKKTVLIEQADEIATEVNRLAEELKSMEGGEGEESVNLPQLLQAIKDVQTALTEQRTTLEELETSTVDIKSTLDAVQTALSDIKTATSGIRSVVDKNTTSLATLQIDVTALKRAVADQSVEMTEVHTAVDGHTASLAAMDEKLTAAQETLDNILSLLKEMSGSKDTGADGKTT